jgi:hypothetical protein
MGIEDDDDTLVYDSSPSRWELFNQINALKSRILELERELEQHRKPPPYFGEK